MKQDIAECIIEALKGREWLSQVEIRRNIKTEVNEATFFRQLKALIKRGIVDCKQRSIYHQKDKVYMLKK